LGVVGGCFLAQGFEQGLEAVGSCGYDLVGLGLGGGGERDVEAQDGAFGGEGDTVVACYFESEGSIGALRLEGGFDEVVKQRRLCPNQWM
jgi:hypothetical protein